MLDIIPEERAAINELIKMNNSNDLSNKLAKDILKETRKTFNQMVKMFNIVSQNFWANKDNIKASEIAQELGLDAKEVFQLHYLLGQLIQIIKPEKIENGLNLIGTFTINEDGTVTVIDNE
jgi:hypothetical protein